MAKKKVIVKVLCMGNGNRRGRWRDQINRRDRFRISAQELSRIQGHDLAPALK